MGRVAPIGDQDVLPDRKLPVGYHAEADGGGLDGGDGIQRPRDIEQPCPHGRDSSRLSDFVHCLAGRVDQRGRDLAGGQAGMRLPNERRCTSHHRGGHAGAGELIESAGPERIGLGGLACGGCIDEGARRGKVGLEVEAGRRSPGTERAHLGPVPGLGHRRRFEAYLGRLPVGRLPRQRGKGIAGTGPHEVGRDVRFFGVRYR